MKTTKAEEYIRGNEKMNSSLCTDWSREMIIESHEVYANEQTTSQKQTIERLREETKTLKSFIKSLHLYKDIIHGDDPNLLYSPELFDKDYDKLIEAEQLLNTTEPN